MKKCIKILSIIGIIFLLSGCFKEYTRRDIIKYVKDEIGLKKIYVSETPDYYDGTDHFEDKVWTVVDKESDIKFYVLDDHYYSSEDSHNVLKNDYYAKKYIKNKANIPDLANINYEKETTYGVFDKIEFNCNFVNRETLDDCYKSLSSLNKYYGGKYSALFRIKYDFIDRNRFSIENKEVDSSGVLDEIEETYNEMLYAYFSYGLRYDIDSIISEFSQEEYYSLLEYDDAEKVYKIDDNKNIIKTYDGVLAKNSYITYQSLYKILYDEGYSVVGNSHNYAVYYNDDVYKFSDDYTEKSANRSYYNTYYIHNGKKVYFENMYHVNYERKLYITDIEKMFNLNLQNITNRNLERWPW